MHNILKMTDSYKVTHHVQYPPKTEYVYSYLESRGGKFPSTIFFGLQYILKEYLLGVQVTEEKIQEAKSFWNAHFGKEYFNEKGWRHILEKHNGTLPVRICAVKEGVDVPVSNVLMTIENTDPECYWLTNYLETLLVEVWYPCTVATISNYCRRLIAQFLKNTGTPELVNFKLHDFGFRGVSSYESAKIGGAAHLINFLGTDTAAAMEMLEKYYGGVRPVGFSIPASEHSTITAWGRENELNAYSNMLEQYPDGLVACVSDSFDIYSACENMWGTELKDRVSNRNGTLVVRPDSGNPAEVVVKVLNILGQRFGFTVNKKGFKVLPDYIRVIQGDGINYDSMREILDHITLEWWSTDNIAFGMGGGLLQQMDRDTQKFAMKASNVVVNGESRHVSKDPITDKGKISKCGRLKLVYNHGLTTVSDDVAGENYLEEVFCNGTLRREQTLEDIRNRAFLYA